MDRIYSDIQSEIVVFSGDIQKVFIYDYNGTQYTPNLIIPNKLALKNLIVQLKKYEKEMFD